MAIITVIGGVNMDISAAMRAPFVRGDSIPGQVTLSCGGVAHNIAHNLCLLGHRVRFVTVFGGDEFGRLCQEQCAQSGLDLSLAERDPSARNGLYLCVNNPDGDMVAAVADMDIIGRITPEFLARRIDDINLSELVVTDTNLSAQALTYLLDHVTAPMMVDAVSTAKAPRIIEALQQSTSRRLHTLKLNRQEAFTAAGFFSTVEQSAQWLTTLGVQHVCVTLGADGVYCTDGEHDCRLPALPVQVVNTTGAGDAFLAGVAHAHVSGIAFPDTAQAGLRAARATLLTTSTVNAQLLEQMINE